MGYAVVLGEALIDLLETDVDGESGYRQAIGGAPLNVAVGATRLGGDVRFAFGADYRDDRASFQPDALLSSIDQMIAYFMATSGTAHGPACETSFLGSVHHSSLSL